MASISNRYYQIDNTNQIIFAEFISNLPAGLEPDGWSILPDTIPILNASQLEDYRAGMPVKVVGNTVTVDDKTLAGNSGALATISFIATETDLNKTCEELLLMQVWDLVYTVEGVLTATENLTKLKEYNDLLASVTYQIRGGATDTGAGVVIENTTTEEKDLTFKDVE